MPERHEQRLEGGGEMSRALLHMDPDRSMTREVWSARIVQLGCHHQIDVFPFPLPLSWTAGDPVIVACYLCIVGRLSSYSECTRDITERLGTCMAARSRPARTDAGKAEQRNHA
jgi:hypothetical protein